MRPQAVSASLAMAVSHRYKYSSRGISAQLAGRGSCKRRAPDVNGPETRLITPGGRQSARQIRTAQLQLFQTLHRAPFGRQCIRHFHLAWIDSLKPPELPPLWRQWARKVCAVQVY